MKPTHQETEKNQRPMRRPIRFAYFAIAALACLSSAAYTLYDYLMRPERRPLDAAPVKTRLQAPVPPGRAEAFFTLNTGGDQMGQRAKEAGLMVIVRVGTDHYQQTIASCPDPGLGSALGGGTERELEIAACDGEYWLISEPGRVSVVRMDKKQEGETITQFDLPDGVRAVTPPDKF